MYFVFKSAYFILQIIDNQNLSDEVHRKKSSFFIKLIKIKYASGTFDEKQMERLVAIGLWCAHPDYGLRPSTMQVLQMLNLKPYSV